MTRLYYNCTVDGLAGMTPADWRALLQAAAQSRCIACGETDACECSEFVTDAVEAILTRSS